MNVNKPLQSKRAGSAIVLVLIAVVILSVMGLGLLRLGVQSRVFAARNASDATARCAADAGLTKALFEMNEKLKVKPWDEDTLPEATDEVLPNCDATFSCTVTGDIGSGFTIESTGKCNEAEKTVNSTLRLQGSFEHAILVQKTNILKADTLVKGYNSLDLSDTNIEVQIGTNSILPESIILNNGVTVDGDVLIGVGGDVESVIKDLGASIDEKYAVPEEIEFPDITPPVLPDMGTDIDVHGTILRIVPADSGKYGNIELKRATNPGILEIDGGDVVLHVTGSIGLGQDCEIRIKDGSSLTLYLDGDLDAHNDAGINNENSPTNFKLYGTAESEQEFDIRAKGDFFGAVYAPNADVTVMANGDIYGAFTTGNFELKSGGNFYYDIALRNVNVDDEAVRFVVQQWCE